MKRSYTTDIQKCIYDFDTYKRIMYYNDTGDTNYWCEESHLHEIFGLDGEEAADIIAEAGYECKATMTPGTLYAFRWNQNHTRLVPFHITFRAKTLADKARARKRFGSDYDNYDFE